MLVGGYRPVLLASGLAASLAMVAVGCGGGGSAGSVSNGLVQGVPALTVTVSTAGCLGVNSGYTGLGTGSYVVKVVNQTSQPVDITLKGTKGEIAGSVSAGASQTTSQKLAFSTADTYNSSCPVTSSTLSGGTSLTVGK